MEEIPIYSEETVKISLRAACVTSDAAVQCGSKRQFSKLNFIGFVKML